MSDTQDKGQRKDSKIGKLTKATDAQTMVVVDKWFSENDCTFEDAFYRILGGMFFSWAELVERIEFSHLRNSRYADLSSRQLREECARLLAYAIRNWKQGTIVRSPMEWTLVFFEQGLEAKWLSLIQRHFGTLAEYKHLEEMCVLLERTTSTRSQNEVPVRDAGRIKGGRARHMGTYASEVKERISMIVELEHIDLSVKEYKQAFVRRACEYFVDEVKGVYGSTKPRPEVDIKTIDRIWIRNRRTVENHIRSLQRR